MTRRYEKISRQLNIDAGEILKPLQELSDCTCCPRDCHVDRINGEHGFCHSGAGLCVVSICAHRGEEPVISGKHGICNIFFAGCNMQCAFCQNYEISRAECQTSESGTELVEIIRQVETILATGSKGVGFVSPSHALPQMKVIMAALKARGYDQTYVFNTNAYDNTEAIISLLDVIDVWLPDLKYMDERLGRLYSDAPNYPQIATAAIKEMYARTGAEIRLDDDDTIESGLIIRHLVLPGEVENSRTVLRWIAEELSPSVHISLMSQYHPTPLVAGHSRLDRTLRAEEYEEVVEEFERLGFYRGWVQELDSPAHYRPDFNRRHPFED